MDESEYLQQTFLGGGYVNLFPYTLKFNYGYFKGDYSYPIYDTRIPHCWEITIEIKSMN